MYMDTEQTTPAANPQAETAPIQPQPPQPEQPPQRLSLKPIHIILTFIFSVLLGVGGLFVYQEYTGPTSEQTLQIDQTEPVHTTPPDETAGWIVYHNSVRNYEIRYPRDWTINTSKAETSTDDPMGAFLTISKNGYELAITWPSAFGPGVCVFDDESRENAPEIADFCEGEFYEFSGSGGSTIHRRLIEPDVLDDRVQWPVYTQDQVHYVTVPPISYSAPLGYDYSEIELMDRILATYTPTPPASVTGQYSCPDTEWVDCMPGPGDEGIRWECTKEYLAWATENCPGFEGAAL